MWKQSIIRLIYPAQCISCGDLIDAHGGLCPACWRETHFIAGAICDCCGAPLPGAADGQILHCDECLVIARPWRRGRAALIYSGSARRMVLGLKHADRTHLAKPVGQWLARAAADLIADDTVIVPVPLHWTRLLKRRYNQAALLAQQVGLHVVRPVCVDALRRPRKTPTLTDHSREARFVALDGAIAINPHRITLLRARPVLLVDDVMTSGATLAACADVLLQAGAGPVDILTLARRVKDA